MKPNCLLKDWKYVLAPYEEDHSGINSLSGFAFQIRVFAYYALKLKTTMKVEFETLEDVNIYSSQKIDEKEDCFLGRFFENGGNVAIQVKRTSLTKDKARKALLNWILLENSDKNVSKYILFTDPAYGNNDIIFNVTAKELHNEIIDSDKNSKAVISKVKILFKNNFLGFEKLYNSIKLKYTFIQDKNIDDLIRDQGSEIFRREGTNEFIYHRRIKDLLDHLTVQIMDAVNNKQSYSLDYTHFMKLIEDISLRNTEDMFLPNYSNFKKTHVLDFTKIASSREVKQLTSCRLPQNLVEQKILQCCYYNSARNSYLEAGKIDTVSNIEERTYENFEGVKFELQQNNDDIPYKRLTQTEQKDNSHALSTEIRLGSCIYLTKDNVGDKQISWEDKDDAKS